MVKLTTGRTTTSTVSFTTVSFSLHVAFAVLFQVPLINVSAVIVNRYDAPTFNFGITILLPLNEVSLDVMYLNCSWRTSSTTTIVALDGPLLVTFIVNTTFSPTYTGLLLTVLSIVKLTTGKTSTVLLSTLFVKFQSSSLELASAMLLYLSANVARELMVNCTVEPLVIFPIAQTPVSLS